MPDKFSPGNCHDFVVLAMATTDLQRKDDGYAAEVALPNEQLSDKPSAIAAWITSGEASPTLQAAGGWLKP